MNLTSILLSGYLILLPWTLHSPFPSSPVNIVWADLWFALLLIYCFIQNWIKQASRYLLRHEKIVFPLLLGILLLNILLSGFTLRGWLKFLGTGYLILIVVVLRMVINSEAMLNRVFEIWFRLALILALSGILAYGVMCWQREPNFFIIKDPSYLGGEKFLWRLRSLGYSCSMLAGYLHLGVISGLWIKTTRTKSWVFLALGSILLAIALTKTRLFLGALVTLAIYLGFHFHRYTQYKRLGIILFGSFLLLFSILVGGSIWYRIYPVSIDFEKTKIKISWNTAPSHYRFFNLLALALFKEHPVVGIGLGRFRNYSQNPEPILQKHYPDFVKVLPREWAVSAHDPHSAYQGWLAETGVMGLSVIIIFWWTFFYSLIKAIQGSKSPIEKEKYIIFLGGLIGFLINGFYVDVLTLRYFWFLIACLGVYLNLHEIRSAH